jgi:membrane dipeptidase
MDIYERLADERPDHFRLVRERRDLAQVVQAWQRLDEQQRLEQQQPNPATPQAQAQDERQARQLARELEEAERLRQQQGEAPEAPSGPPVGLIVSMEGADAILEPAEVERWWERGVRIVGPAWHGTAYSGGTGQPGPLTRLGFELLEHMARLNAGLDLTHLDEIAARQALDTYPGPLLASHSNAHALIKDASNRHLSDGVIAGIIERGGVIGIVPFIAFLKGGWKRGGRREEGSLAQVAAQIDYICQMAGNARHVGFGTDFDGGFGVQSVPPEIDTIADLHKLAPLLAEKGYTAEDLSLIFGGNWLALLERILPESV